MVLLLLLAVFADVVSPHSPIQQFRDHFLTPPVWEAGRIDGSSCWAPTMSVVTCWRG